MCRQSFRAIGAKEERKLVLDAWLETEEASGQAERVAVVSKRMPKTIKKKRPLQGTDGEQAGWEEYNDYIYPEEEAQAPSLKILEMAHKWKKQKVDE